MARGKDTYKVATVIRFRGLRFQMTQQPTMSIGSVDDVEIAPFQVTSRGAQGRGGTRLGAPVEMRAVAGERSERMEEDETGQGQVAERLDGWRLHLRL